MKPKHLFAIALFCLIGLPAALFIKAAGQTSATSTQDVTQASDYQLSGPYIHKNLTVFLVHGKDQTKKTFLTLQEALAQRKVRVYETKDVNELAIRNFSNQDVYVQAGDIVRGGEQDRTISMDFIVPPRSRRMPIAAFCVESGRWSPRAGEAPASFGSSNNSVATNEMKLAIKSAKSQEAVWENVSKVQGKLVANVSRGVINADSPTSLALSVENSAMKATTAEYITALSGIARGRTDVIGYVLAVNGQVKSADIYASHALFAKLWPKLVNASAVEAVAELQPQLQIKPVADDSVRGFLAESERPKATTEVTPHVKLVTREDDKTAFFETQDRSQKDNWVHRNYIRKQ